MSTDLLEWILPSEQSGGLDVHAEIGVGEQSDRPVLVGRQPASPVTPSRQVGR